MSLRSPAKHSLSEHRVKPYAQLTKPNNKIKSEDENQKKSIFDDDTYSPGLAHILFYFGYIAKIHPELKGARILESLDLSRPNQDRLANMSSVSMALGELSVELGNKLEAYIHLTSVEDSGHRIEQLEIIRQLASCVFNIDLQVDGGTDWLPSVDWSGTSSLKWSRCAVRSLLYSRITNVTRSDKVLHLSDRLGAAIQICKQWNKWIEHDEATRHLGLTWYKQFAFCTPDLAPRYCGCTQICVTSDQFAENLDITDLHIAINVVTLPGITLPSQCCDPLYCDSTTSGSPFATLVDLASLPSSSSSSPSTMLLPLTPPFTSDMSVGKLNPMGTDTYFSLNDYADDNDSSLDSCNSVFRSPKCPVFPEPKTDDPLPPALI